YMGWRSTSGSWPANTLVVTADLVVVRDDKGGASAFASLKDPTDGLAGNRVALGIRFPFHHDSTGVPGQQRLGGDVAIAVDPNDSKTVYVAWGDLQSAVYTLHVRRSNDGGPTWSPQD